MMYQEGIIEIMLLKELITDSETMINIFGSPYSIEVELKEKYDEIVNSIFIPDNSKVNLDEISTEWLNTPNLCLGNITPQSIIGTDREWVIVDLIANIEQGYLI